MGSMPKHGFDRCDGHHEMDDSKLRKKIFAKREPRPKGTKGGVSRALVICNDYGGSAWPNIWP
jgi:hypothetical protein